MIHYKSEEEIRKMQEGGKRLQAVTAELFPRIVPGMQTQEIESIAHILIKKNGGTSSFKRVDGYHWSTCLAVNEQAVHTPPSKRILLDGDILTVDIGIFYEGYHVDYADTVIVGVNADPEKKRFLRAGKEALDNAIAQARYGNRIGDISKASYDTITGYGYHILKELTGHGVGRDLHEDPYIPNFLDRPVAKTQKLLPGLVIAVEVIYSVGTEKIAYEPKNEWSIITADRSLSACFEHSIAITEKETFILA